MTRDELDELLAPLYSDSLDYHAAHFQFCMVEITVTKAESGDAAVILGTGVGVGLLLHAIVETIRSHDDPVAAIKDVLARRRAGISLN
jgi:hypothetical protein